MQMSVKDVLTANGPDIPADVIPLWLESFIQMSFCSCKQCERGFHFFLGQVKNRLTMSARYNNSRSNQYILIICVL